jgi:hypothetical protein
MSEANRAWDHWYHCTAWAYGRWLRGDPRGWRERDHREHVEGDYKNPPKPSKLNDALFKQSKDRMKFPPVTFAPAQRPIMGKLAMESLAIQKIQLAAISVAGAHLHLLIRCPNDNPKVIVGKVKNHIWMHLVNGGPKLKVRDPENQPPPFWAVDSHPKSICDKQHGTNAVIYILDHEEEGAWVWAFRDPRPKRRT